MGFGIAASAAATVAGSLLKGSAAAKAAKLDKKAAKAQKEATIKAAKIEGAFARENAEFTRENGQIILSLAAQEAAQSDRASRLRLGSIRAAAGASGGRLHSGSIVDIISDTAAQGELEKQNILFRGRLGLREEEQKAKGFDVQVQLQDIRIEAAEKGAELAKSAAKSAGGFGVASALLGGASGLIGMFGGGK